MSAPLDKILARLDGVRMTGKRRGVARCPAHDDHSPSLSFAESDSEAVLLHCFAGCQTTDILAAIGMTYRDCYPDDDRRCRRRWREDVMAPKAAPVAPAPIAELVDNNAWWELSEDEARAFRAAYEQRMAAWRAKCDRKAAAFHKDLDQLHKVGSSNHPRIPTEAVEHGNRAIAGCEAAMALAGHRWPRDAIVDRMRAELEELSWAKTVCATPDFTFGQRAVLRRTRQFLQDTNSNE